MSSNGNRPNEFECTATVDELVRPYGTAREARGTAPPTDKCVLTLQQGPREGGKELSCIYQTSTFVVIECQKQNSSTF